MKKHISTFLAFIPVAFVALGVALLFGTSIASAQAVAQSYTADTAVQAGMVVQLADDKSKIKPLTEADASKMLGIVIQPNDAPLSLSGSQAGQQVYVATTGTYKVLVSDQNGPIKKGDYLVVSAVEGIGMKVNDSSQYAIGKAAEDFDGKNNVRSSATLKDSKGSSRTVNFGTITTDINLSRNPLLKVSQPSTLPNFLQKATDSIANKPVPTIRAYISLVIAGLTAIIACTVLYAGIRTSVTSLSRNPLARSTIFRNLIQVVLIGVIILVTGMFAVYLILKL